MPRKRKRRERKPEPDPPRDTEQHPTSKGRRPAEYTDLVLLVHAVNLAEAEMYRAKLESYGIPAILEGEGAPIAVIPGDGAGVPVLVPEEFADQAAELIAELESAKPEGKALAEKKDLFDEDEEEGLDENLEEDIDAEEDLEELDEDEDAEEEEADEEAEEEEDEEEWEEEEDEEDEDEENEDEDEENEDEWDEDDDR